MVSCRAMAVAVCLLLFDGRAVEVKSGGRGLDRTDATRGLELEKQQLMMEKLMRGLDPEARAKMSELFGKIATMDPANIDVDSEKSAGADLAALMGTLMPEQKGVMEELIGGLGSFGETTETTTPEMTTFEFEASLDHSDGTTYGMAADPLKKGLLIREVHEAGLIAKWNEQYGKHVKIQAGDLVVSANNVKSGGPDVLKELKKKASMKLKVTRQVPKEKGDKKKAKKKKQKPLPLDDMEKLLAQLDPAQQKKLEAMFGVSETSPVVTKMSIKKARAMMKELRDELTSRQARRTFQRATKGKAEADKFEQEARFARRAPLVEMYVGDIIEKYGFEKGPGKGGKWGLQHAVQAAAEAGQANNDTQISAAIDDFTGVVLGTNKVNMPTLDALAEEFLDMDEKNRTKALQKAQKTPGGELYAQTMKNIILKGDAYIVNLYREFEREWEKEEESIGKKEELRDRLNVIREFLREELRGNQTSATPKPKREPAEGAPAKDEPAEKRETHERSSEL